MRWGVVLLAGVLGLSGAIAGLPDARAQNVASSAGDAAADGQTAADIAAPRRMQGWAVGAGQSAAPGTMGLVFTPADRALTLADVQKIAEAWLVWHGNHDWRVTNLTSDADHVSFAIATAASVVVATFTMDRHTGALARTG